jgi:hypothetical protein
MGRHLGCVVLATALAGSAGCQTEAAQVPATQSEESESASSSGEGGSESSSSSSSEASTGSDLPDESSETETGAELEASSEASDSASFVESDIGEPTGQCSTWVLDDCPEGRKCAAANFDMVPPIWHTTLCFDVEGDKALGDECSMMTQSIYSGRDDCAPGGMCFYVDKWTDLGVCTPYCQGDESTPECPTGSSCWVAYDGVLAICTPDCDPLAQDCVLDKQTCLPRPDESGYGCFQKGVDLPGDFGEPCGAFNFCNEGLMCIPGVEVPAIYCHEATRCCSSFCDLDGAEPCPGAGQSCVPVFDEQPPGYENVGVCRGHPIIG